MAINPMKLMKLKDRYGIFKKQHPRVLNFLKDVNAHSLQAGTVVEMKITNAEGRESVCNMRLSPEDIETINMLKGLRSKK